jgi:hypothetical protein
MDPIETSSASDGKNPEKYIRTFESDLDVVQRGGTPGLAPLKAAEAAPAERLIEASPIVVTPDEASEPAPSPEPAPIPPAKKKEVMPPPIETYAEDFRQRVKDTDASRLTVLAAEQDAGPQTTPEDLSAPTDDTHGRWYVAGGAVLLILGVMGAYLAFAHYQATTAPVIVATASIAPIFVDSSETVGGSGGALVQSIVQSVAKPIAPNSVAELSLADATSSDPIFLKLGVPVPGILIRNIVPKGSMAGVVHASTGQSPFFILSVDLYSATFSGMLSWEPTMQRDLNALFPLYPAVQATASTTATSTGAAPAPSAKLGFRDETISNHDVRIYRDQQGRSILLYGYWNQNTLIIARDGAAFSEILDRLATSRAQ